VSVFSKRRFHTRPVNDVIDEIRSLAGRSFLFIDDNLAADFSYACSLLKALVPLRRRWFAQMGVPVTGDPAFLDLLRASGCRGVFMGFESLQPDSLTEVGKRFNRADSYVQAVDQLHTRGISVMGALVLGFDHDTPACFDVTRRFLRKGNLDALQLTVLTPLPGTPLYSRFKADGRIFDHNWQHYDLGHVVFRPRHLTPAELAKGHARLLREFYSWQAIMVRAIRQIHYLAWPDIALAFTLGIGYRFKLRKTGVMERCAGEQNLVDHNNERHGRSRGSRSECINVPTEFMSTSCSSRLSGST